MYCSFNCLTTDFCFPKRFIFRRQAYSSAHSQRSPIYISEWLIFYCGNFIVHQKQKWKWSVYDKKQQNMPCKYMRSLSNIFLWPRPTDSWFNMLCTLHRRRKCIGIILSGKHTPEENMLWTLAQINQNMNSGEKVRSFTLHEALGVAQLWGNSVYTILVVHARKPTESKRNLRKVSIFSILH